IWILRNGLEIFSAAAERHFVPSYAALAWTMLGYAIGGLLYVAVPIVAVLIAARPNRSGLADILWPAGPRRRFATVIFWVTYLTPLLPSLALHARVDSLWTLASFSLLPFLLLGSPAIKLSSSATK